MKSLLFFLPALALGIVIPLLLANRTTISEITPPRTAPPLHTRFSLEDAPSDSLRGMMSDFSGEISWESRTATTPATLTAPRRIQQGEILQTGSQGHVTVTFAKSCSVSLRPDTEVNFAQTLPTTIVLEQPSGATSIATYCATPLSIRSMHLLIKQQAGTMSLIADELYEQITLKVTSGSAQVAYNDSDNISTVLTLNKGDILSYDDTTRTTSVE